MKLEAYIKMPSGFLLVMRSKRAKNGVWWEIPHPLFNPHPSDELMNKILDARMEIARSVIPRGRSVLTLPASQQALSPYILSSCKSDRKTALVAYAHALGEFLGAEKVSVHKIKKNGDTELIPKQVAPAFAHMPAQHGRQGERAEIRLPNGDVFNYELWTTTVDGFWLCKEDENHKVFDELRMEPEGYCLKYYTPRGGSWPAISLKEYPDWRKRLLDAMSGFADHGCTVTIFDSEGNLIRHNLRYTHTQQPEDELITAVVTIDDKQYEHTLFIKYDEPEAAWWDYSNGPNFKVFEALDIDPKEYCAEYYTEVGKGAWPYISTREPGWKEKLRWAMLGLAKHGAKVVVTYPDGSQYEAVNKSAVAYTPAPSRATVEDLVGVIKPTWTSDELDTIKRFLHSLIREL